MTRATVRATKLYDGTGAAPRRDVAVVVEDGRILDLLPLAQTGDLPVLYDAAVLTPGFVDTQINGGGGVMFDELADEATIPTIAAAARHGGTAWLLPTFITAPGTAYQAAVDLVRQAMATAVPGIIGVHLEGPFLAASRAGIHPPGAIRTLAPDDVDFLVAAQIPLLLTLAPECAAPADTRRLAAAGVRLFAGHSDAQPADLALHPHISGATHLFNAMSQMIGRAPGLVGSVFASDHLFAGIITDGVHVDPVNLRAAYRALGSDRLFLVTDAMPPLGTDQQHFTIAGRAISRADGRLTAADGTLAGADIAMDQCVQRIIALAGTNRADAIKMVTLTPARALGLEGQIGTIRPGLRAGFTALDADFNAQAVIIDGVLMVDHHKSALGAR